MDALLKHVRAVLSTAPGRWSSLAETLPVELLTRAPAPNEWSALECLQHVLDTEQLVLPVRLRALLAGRDFEAFNPDAQGTKGSASQRPAELAARFAQRRAENLEALSAVTTQDLARTARHSELEIVTLAEFLHEWAAHDLAHIVQAERAVMQPFIAGSGPWRPYFADHDVGTLTQ